MNFQFTGEYTKRFRESSLPEEYRSSQEQQAQQRQALAEQVQPKEGGISKVLSAMGGVMDWGQRGMEAITGKKYQGYDDITTSTTEKLASMGKYVVEHSTPPLMMAKLLFPEATQKGVDTASNKIMNLAGKAISKVTDVAGKAGKWYWGKSYDATAALMKPIAERRAEEKGETLGSAYEEKMAKGRELAIGLGEMGGRVMPAMGAAVLTSGASLIPRVGLTAAGLTAEAVSSRIPQESKLYQALNSLKFSNDPLTREAVGDMGAAVIADPFEMVGGIFKGINKIFLGGKEDIVSKIFRDYGTSKFGRDIDTLAETQQALRKAGIDEALAPRYITTFNNQVLKGAGEMVEDVSGKIGKKAAKIAPLPTKARQANLVISQFIRPHSTAEEAFGAMVKYVDDTTANIDLLRKTGTRLAREDFLTSNDMQKYIDQLATAKSRRAVKKIAKDISELRGGARVIDYYGKFGSVSAGEGVYKGMKDYLLDKLGVAAKKLPKEVDIVDVKTRGRMQEALDVGEEFAIEKKYKQAGKNVVYHGTSSGVEDMTQLDALEGSVQSLYGQGIYLTDSPEIAKQYAKADRRGIAKFIEGKVKPEGRILSGILPDDIRLLDFDRNLSPKEGEAFRKAFYSMDKYGDFDDIDFTKMKGRDAYKRLIDELQGWSTSEGGMVISDLHSGLQNLGYQGLKHRGGLAMGRELKHNVTILFPLEEGVGVTTSLLKDLTSERRLAEQVTSVARELRMPRKPDLVKIEGYKFIKSPKGVPEFYASLSDVSTKAQRTKLGRFWDSIFGGKENVVLSAKVNDRLRKEIGEGLTDYQFGVVRKEIRKLMEDAHLYNIYGLEESALNTLGARLGKDFNKDLSGLSQKVFDSYTGEIMDKGLGAITNRFLASNLPGADMMRKTSARLVPSLRYRYNPMFKAQEALEPGIWAASRGIAPLREAPEGMVRRVEFTRESLAAISDVMDEQGRLMTRTAQGKTGLGSILHQIKEGIFGAEAGIRRQELASSMIKQSADYSLLNHAQELGIKRLAKENTTDFVNRIYDTAKTVKNRNWDKFNKAIALSEADAWADVANILYLPSSKSMLERTLNSTLLFWPISYTKRVTKEATKLLYSSFGGVKTGVLGATLMHRLAEMERKESETNRDYREWKERNRTTLFVLQRFIPVDVTETFIYASPIMQSSALLALSAFKGDLEENDFAKMIAFTANLNIEYVNSKQADAIPTFQNAIIKQTLGAGARGSLYDIFGVYKEQRDNWQRNQRLETLKKASEERRVEGEEPELSPALQRAKEFRLKYGN